jgi:hypothetical protein
MNIPQTVSGRTVTNRGAHGPAFGHHGGWLPDADAWTERWQKMYLSFIVWCSEGDSVVKPMAEAGGRSVAEVSLDAGIIPVMRPQVKLNYAFPDTDHVKALVKICDRYGAPALVLLGNEPNMPDAWKDGKVPRDWFTRYISWFSSAAPGVISVGAYAGFADKPCYEQSPFDYMADNILDTFAAEYSWYAGHFYGLNRPPLYPYDVIQRTGKPHIEGEGEVKEWFGPHYQDAGFNDLSFEEVSAARDALANPNLTAVEDATCFRGYERIQAWMLDMFQNTLPIGMTEGGWTPKAFAGSGTDREKRYLRPTPQHVAKWTLEVLNDPTIPLLFQCHWILAGKRMGVFSGAWEEDCWYNDVWPDIYPTGVMPVVAALQANPPRTSPPVASVDRAQANVKRAQEMMVEMEGMVP